MSSKNTHIYLYSGCGLDSDYVNVYNGSPDNVNKTLIAELTSNSYIRPELGKCTLACTITSSLYNVNYAKFVNFDGKAFFAFVSNIEYVNDNCIQVNFKIDLFGTYYPNATLNKCYVERQHTNNDTIGYNLQPEPNCISVEVSKGEYDLSVGVGYRIQLSTDDGGTYHSTYYGDGEMGATYDQLYTSGADMAQRVVDLASDGKANKIVRLSYYPTTMSTRTFTRPNNIDGYVPKNNKCLSGLYQKLVVSNNLGQSQEYVYERGNGDSITFTMLYAMTGDPTVIMYPTWYDKVSNNTNAGLIYDNFMNIPTMVDTYSEMYNNNYYQLMTTAIRHGTNLGVGVGSAIVSKGASLADGKLANGVFSAVDFIARDFDLQNSSTRVQINNATSSGTINMRTGKVGFTVFEIQARRNEIALIDEYFTRYGYAQNTAMTPNPNARGVFCYIKTRGASVRGSMPDEARKLIQNVLDKGVTFWNVGDVGNFGLDNSL